MVPILPIVVESVGIDPAWRDHVGDHILPEIDHRAIDIIAAQRLAQGILSKDVDAHRREVGARFGGLLLEFDHPTIGRGFEDAEAGGLFHGTDWTATVTSAPVSRWRAIIGR